MTALTNFIFLPSQEALIPNYVIPSPHAKQNEIKLKMKRKKEETNENYEIGNKIKYYLKEKKEKMRD